MPVEQPNRASLSSSLTSPNFPFTAIAGQERLKLAVILAAINPLIGGVLISGPRGTAKSTLARGFAELLPNDKRHAFTNLPLGASEEMLVGTLDLQQVLSDGQVSYKPGLLAKADGGVLYVDEVNLLPDTLVDLLLDVVASGINRVERDGISHSHKSEFLLVGTMNPDEGDLRPQLKDRFGLAVELDQQYSVAERVEIVRRREAFDADPEAFCQQFSAQQEALRHDIADARFMLHKVQCCDTVRADIAERCFAAQVEGVRADIIWYRAALAHAAWSQRSEVLTEDIDAVEALILAHRANEPREHSEPKESNDSRSDGSRNKNARNQPPPSAPPPSKGAPPSKGPTGKEKGSFSRPQASRSTQSSTQSSSHSSGESDWGGLPPQPQTTVDLSSPLLSKKLREVALSGFASMELKNGVSSTNNRRLRTESNGSKVPSNMRSGCVGRGKKQDQLSNKPAWFTTLVASFASGEGWPPRRLRYKRTKTGAIVLNYILLDASASTLGDQLLGRAKALVLEISEWVYLKREQLAMLTFGHAGVDSIFTPRRAPKTVAAFMDKVEAGGGTPLRDALLHLCHQQQRYVRKVPDVLFRTWLLTDGLTRQQVGDIELQGECHLIDLEASVIKRGRAKEIATALGATYFACHA